MSTQQREAYIVDAIRTPTGRRRGGLAHVHAADLGGFILRQIVERNAIPAEDYDDVVFGAIDSIGPLAGNVARTCWLAAGLPLTVPGVTIDRMCGSSQQAVHFAAQAVMSGNQDVVIAGGVQTMSQIPIGTAMGAGGAAGHARPVLRQPRLGGALRRPAGVAIPRRLADRGEMGIFARGDGGVTRWKATTARCVPRQRGGSTARSCRWKACSATKRRAPPAWRRWRRSSRSPAFPD